MLLDAVSTCATKLWLREAHDALLIVKILLSSMRAHAHRFKKSNRVADDAS